MATVAGDVPGLYDVVVNVSGGNTTGFVFNDALESSLPFRTHKATYTYSPTFVPRQNVQGDFGDNQQDFFLTATQKDWSLGEGQRYFRSTDEDARRRYWQGDAADVSAAPGSVSMRGSIGSPALGTIRAVAGPIRNLDYVWAATSTNLEEWQAGTTVADKGAHGLGAAPSSFGLASDGQNAYLTGTTAGTVGVRKWNTAAFSTFSATAADSLCFLNNTLYGYRETSGDLIRYDTAGAVTSLFTWKDAAGTAITGSNTKTRLRAFGGKLLILRHHYASDRLGELWIYDGTAPSKLAEFAGNFFPWECETSLGTVFVSGLFKVSDGSTTKYASAILYYSGGSIGELWRSASPTTSAISAPGIGRFDRGLVFDDQARQTLMYYDVANGGVSAIGAFTGGTVNGSNIVGTPFGILAVSDSAANARSYPAAVAATSATLTTSLFEFESSLKKYMRGITVEFDSATDGNGGSVDVAYRLEDVDGSYTSLATGVTSGSENLLSGVSGKRISVKVTLNKGTSTSGPVLKRIYVRAAPIQTRFKQREYILSCIGDPASEDRQILRDGMSSHPLAGRKQADQLVLAAASQTPLTLTDRFGTYTGIIETLEIYEQHANNDDPSASGSFVVKVATREI